MRVRSSTVCVDEGRGPLFPGVRDGSASSSIRVHNVRTITFHYIKVWKARDQLRYTSSGCLNLYWDTDRVLIVLDHEDYWEGKVTSAVE